MDSLENIRKLKQQFLKREIMDYGFDPKEFSEYMQSKKENGTEIDSWTLVELEGVVRNY